MKRLTFLFLAMVAAAGADYVGLIVNGGPFVEVPVALTPDDVTPSVATGNVFYTGINTGATAITDLDNPTVGATYTIMCGSIAGGFQSTIADGGNFTLDGAWAPATVGDSITLFCVADNDYREVARGYAVAGPRQGDPFQAGADAVGTPGYTWIGDLDTGVYHIGADSPGVAVGGANVGTWDAAGYQGALGQTTPAAADVTTLTTTGVFDAVVGAVGAPSRTWTGDLDTGSYWVGANSYAEACGGAQVALYDATGVTAVGLNGPIGTVTPAQGEFTNIYGSADFYFGQTPADLHEGYKERGEYVTFVETFDVGNDADLAVRWDLTNVGGLGTNDETTLDGWNRLITGGGGGPDWESTRSWGLNHNAAYAPRIECVVDLATVAAGQTFYFGFWAAANRYCEIIHEPATSANWLLRIDDTAGAETEDSGVAATVNPTKLEIAITAGGVPSWAIDDVAMPVTGITNLMANDHYVEWRILDVAAAAHTVDIDYFISEQLRQQ